MIEYFQNASKFGQGLFIMLCGLVGVFLVLLLFYLFIKLTTRFISEKPANEADDD